MTEKFKGKYRNESARLQIWDYGSDAAYFITICTKDREHYFGEIKDKKLQISPAGAIAAVLWFEIKNHAQHIQLGEFVVMPNHVHGILILDGNHNLDSSIAVRPMDTGTTAIGGETPVETTVGTTHALSLRPENNGSIVVGTVHAISLLLLIFHPTDNRFREVPLTSNQKQTLLIGVCKLDN